MRICNISLQMDLFSSISFQVSQAQGELDNIEEFMREINLLNQKVNADAGVVALLKSTLRPNLSLSQTYLF